MSFIPTLFTTLPNWDNLAKGSLKHKAGYLSTALVMSILMSTGVMTPYKAGRKFFQKTRGN